MECECGGVPIRYSYVQPPLFDGDDAEVEVVTLCPDCLRVDVLERARITP